MNHTDSYNCHAFLDNTNFVILEVSFKTTNGAATENQYEWLLIRKSDLTIRNLHLKARDSSASVQERFFDMGYLKYDYSAGVFIQADTKELHPLEHLDCQHIPEPVSQAVGNYLNESIRGQKALTQS